MTEVPGRTGHRPRCRTGLVGAEQQAVALLAEVHVAFVIDTRGQAFVAALGDLGDRVRDQVMVLHGLNRQMHACELGHLAGPQAARVDDNLGVDAAPRRHHIPAAIGTLIGFQHRRIGVVVSAVHARGLGISVGDTGRIDVAVQRIPQGGDVMGGIDQRMAAGGLLHRDKLLIETHVARLRSLTLQIVVPVLVGCQIKAPGRVHAHRLTRCLLDLFVQIDGVALEPGDVGIGADGVNLPGGVPARAGSELGALEQHDILPTKFRQVKEDRAADDTAADDDDLRV